MSNQERLEIEEVSNTRWERAAELQELLNGLRRDDEAIYDTVTQVEQLASYLGSEVYMTVVSGAAVAALVRRELGRQVAVREISILQPSQSIRPANYNQGSLNAISENLVAVMGATVAMGQQEVDRLNNVLAGVQIATASPDVRAGAHDALTLLRESRPSLPTGNN